MTPIKIGGNIKLTAINKPCGMLTSLGYTEYLAKIMVMR